MTEVSFTQMKDGTQADYEFLEQLENDHISGLPDRIMKALAGLSDGLAGYKIDRLQHSLQTATRAEDDGASIDWIVAALVHDIGDELAPLSHSEFAAALLKPFVSEEIVWVIEKHGLFQAYYYAHHVGVIVTPEKNTKTIRSTINACTSARLGIKHPSTPITPRDRSITSSPW